LVAPLTLSDGAFVAAGSVVTNDVSAKELAVGRARQRNITGWQRPDEKKD
jgi:bifunctional UDP-N-acetylglucosamine pyrophosphorylase/glucosamine-1-phosphate N-acetyltransferase